MGIDLTKSGKVCFFICPLKAEKSSTRKRTMALYERVVRPVVEALGYKVLLPNMLPNSGDIPIAIMSALLNVPLVIADLSDHNPNVLYELGVRHALEKPVIQLISKGGLREPFDVAHINTIRYDLRSPRSLENCREILTNLVVEIETGELPLSTPIAQARRLHRERTKLDLTAPSPRHAKGPGEAYDEPLLNKLKLIWRVARSLDLRKESD